MAVNPGETWTATSTDVACTLEKVLPSTLCTLSCAAGFLLSQMLDATTCQYDGSVAAWTGTVPQCLGEEECIVLPPLLEDNHSVSNDPL